MSDAPARLPPATPTPVAPDGRAAAVMLLLCLTWSLQQVSLKAVADQASPMLMVALRSVVAAALLALVMARRGERLQRAHWGAGAAVGALFAVEYLLVAVALQLTQAAHVVVFLYTAPLFAALGLHLLVPTERLRRAQWAGLSLAFAGIAWAFLGGDGGGGAGGSAAAPPGQARLGDALALLAGAAWGATTVTIRRSALARAPATETLQYQLLGAFALLLPASALWGGWRFEPVPVVWAHLAFQAVVVSFASFLAWFWLLRRYLGGPLGVFSFLTPLFGVALGVLLLGERLQPAFVAGSALVLVGVVVVSADAAGLAPWRRRGGAGAAGAVGNPETPAPGPR